MLAVDWHGYCLRSAQSLGVIETEEHEAGYRPPRRCGRDCATFQVLRPSTLFPLHVSACIRCLKMIVLGSGWESAQRRYNDPPRRDQPHCSSVSGSTSAAAGRAIQPLFLHLRRLLVSHFRWLLTRPDRNDQDQINLDGVEKRIEFSEVTYIARQAPQLLHTVFLLLLPCCLFAYCLVILFPSFVSPYANE